MLIRHGAVPPAPVWWEHTPAAPSRRGSVVVSALGGYTAVPLIRQPSGAENGVRRHCASLHEAEAWLDREVGGGTPVS